MRHAIGQHGRLQVHSVQLRRHGQVWQQVSGMSNKRFLRATPMNQYPLRVRLALAGVLLAGIVAPQLRAADVVIHVHRHEQGAIAALTGTVTAQSVANPSRSLTFPLPAADWFLSAHIADDWSEPRLVSVHDPSQTADLNTFPLARVTARIAMDVGKEPRELRAYFQRVSLEDLDSPMEGNVVCDVARARAPALTVNPSPRIALSIRSRVSREMGRLPDNA